MTRDEVIALVVQKAHQYIEQPVEILGGVIAESNLDPNAARFGVWPDVSFGLLQQTVKFADEGDQSNTPSNVDLIRRLYSDPSHALDVGIKKFTYWRHNPEVPALTAWCAYNMPVSYHTPESNPNIGNYRNGLVQAATILGTGPVTTGNRLYVPSIPDSVILQKNDWSCAVRSAYAVLWSMQQKGLIDPVSYGDDGPRDVYNWMVPEFDDPSVGLHAADGSGLVTMFRRHWVVAYAVQHASIDEVRERAGVYPAMIGGRAWNHWVCVNGLEPDGTLILANPAPGFGGIRNELLTSFDKLGPMTLVWVDVPVAGVVSKPDLATLVGVAYNEDGSVVPALVRATTQVDVGLMRQQVQAVINFLRDNRPR